MKMKDGDLLTTRGVNLLMSVVFGTDKGHMKANNQEYDIRIEECVCNDGERFTGDSMRWALHLVKTGRVKKIQMKENGKVRVDIRAWVPSRQGRVHFHRGLALCVWLWSTSKK